MSNQNIRAIVFDLDDTLYTSDARMLDVARRLLGEVGLDKCSGLSDQRLQEAFTRGPDRWLSGYMQKNDADRHWKPSRDLWVEYGRRLLQSLGVKESKEFAANMILRWMGYGVDMRSHLPEKSKLILEELHSRNYRLGLATNRWEDPTPLLDRDSILHLFDAVEYSRVPGYMKPSPFMLIQAASRLGTNPARCAYVGDFVSIDIEAAKRAGMKPYLLTCYSHNHMEQIPPEVIVVERIMELLDLFP